MTAATWIAPDELMAFIDHEVRNSVTIISDNARSLPGSRERCSAGDRDGTSRDGAGERIEQGARNLSSFVSTLAAIALSGAGAWQLESTLIQSAVPRILSRLAPACGGRAVSFDAPRDLRPVVVNERILEIVMKNLVSNAHKYSAPGEPIAISAWEDGGRVVLSVRNSGRVVQQDLERIFEMAYRCDDESGQAGSCVGLAECRSLVNLLGGSIKALLPPDGGFEVRVVLRRMGDECQRATRVSTPAA